MKVPTYKENMSAVEFVQTINKLRLMNKNSWYGCFVTVENKQVSIKGFGTWLQIFKINNVDYSGTMDISIKAFKNHLENSINKACNISA